MLDNQQLCQAPQTRQSQAPSQAMPSQDSNSGCGDGKERRQRMRRRRGAATADAATADATTADAATARSGDSGCGDGGCDDSGCSDSGCGDSGAEQRRGEATRIMMGMGMEGHMCDTDDGAQSTTAEHRTSRYSPHHTLRTAAYVTQHDNPHEHIITVINTTIIISAIHTCYNPLQRPQS